jgi:hypothetical protein
MEEKRLLEAIRLLINHINDGEAEETAPVMAGLMELRDLL